MDSIANIRDLDKTYPGWRYDPGYLYCGRANSTYHVRRSLLANPYDLNKSTQTRDVVCDRFDAEFPKWEPKVAYLRSLPLDEPLVFVCWCVPERCHCRTFVRIREEWRQAEAAAEAEAEAVPVAD